MVTATELYEQFVDIIKQAVHRKNIFAVTEAAEELGFTGSEIPVGGSGQRWEYSFTDANGVMVEVHARWSDKSKPFSIQPDMHVMSVTLRTNPSKRYDGHYEE